MRRNCKSSCNNKCGCQKEKKVNCSCVKPSINYEKCENLAEKSRELYDQALCCNKKIEKFTILAAQAECRAKQLEEEAKAAWCEFNQLKQQANNAAVKAEELMNQSCHLLQKAQDCYSQINNNCNDSNSNNNGGSCNCNCNCGR
ncbi:hypothetical protein [Romboutsia lituseburensis]|uniref:hypothetical protein n=1 Tax=Romboutsia lituseburensis TaxID=1537 RepID=UPI00215AA120|nr:hypothetical protein [Romboutsia lituseburensis]MCR8744137.1 hypothetical protein [Romboutsia lituseburensis]